MSFEAITYVKQLDGDGIDGAQGHLLLRTIAEHTFNDTFVCRVCQTQLAYESGRASERTIRRHLDALETARVIIRHKTRNADGQNLPDAIRIVGFKRWYLRDHAGKQARFLADQKGGRTPPDKLAGGAAKPRKQDGATGQIGRWPPASRSPVATGQQVSGPYKDSGTSPGTSLPPAPQGERENGLEIGWAKGWTPAAREALAEVRGSVTNGHVASAYVDAVRATHNPPRDIDAAAFVRQLGHRLGKFPAEALAALAEDTLATRSRDLEPALDLERKAKGIATRLAAAAAGVTAVPGAGGMVSIRPTSPEWPAFLAHLEAKDPARAESERRRAPSSSIAMPAEFLAACVARFGPHPATGATS